MNTKIIVEYNNNTLDHLDQACGVSAYKKKLQKRKIKYIAPFSTLIRKTRNRAVLFLVFGLIVLLLSIPMLIFTMKTSILYRIFHVAVLLYEFGFGFFFFWLFLTMQKSWKKQIQVFQSDSKSGQLIFDDYGIEDHTDTGKTIRLPWSDYEMCVIAGDTITLLMGNIFYYMPAEGQKEQVIRDALTSYGKGSTIVSVPSLPHRKKR